MELDNLKSLWKKDTEENTPEISLEKQSQINSPLDMMKLNMRTEFWLVIIYLVCSVRISSDSLFSNAHSFYYSVASVFAISVIVYFYVRLRIFYKKFSTVSRNTNYSLLNLKTELMVTKEIFLSYYVLYVPINVLLFIIDSGMKQQTGTDIVLFLLSVGISVILILLARWYWLYYMYGKYIDQIVALIDELNGVESNYIPRKMTYFERSQMYLINKWGLIGNILNVVLWFAILSAAAAAIFFIVALVVLKTGSALGWVDLQQMRTEILNSPLLK